VPEVDGDLQLLGIEAKVVRRPTLEEIQLIGGGVTYLLKDGLTASFRFLVFDYDTQDGPSIRCFQ